MTLLAYSFKSCLPINDPKGLAGIESCIANERGMQNLVIIFKLIYTRTS